MAQKSSPKSSKEEKSTQESPPRIPDPRKTSTTYAAVLFSICVAFAAWLLVRTNHKPQNNTVLSPLVDGDVEAQVVLGADVEKRDAVVEAFKHAWSAYERDAMGADEYHPISKKGSNLTSAGGIGYTVVDTLDTMLIMGLDEEFARAREWVVNDLSFDRDAKFNTFETTIRVLGGLLSAYHLSGQGAVFLERAVDLADRLMPVFDTPTGIPLSLVNLNQRKGFADADNHGMSSTAEATTLQLEFRYLTHLTDNDDYWDRAEEVMRVVKKNEGSGGLATIFLNPENGQFMLSEVRLGSRADSYYEYLLKQYLQTNRSEPVYHKMYDTAMQGIHDHLLRRTPKRGLVHTVELLPQMQQNGQIAWHLVPKQDHLVCFLGGSLMLGSVTAGARGSHVSIPPKLSELTPTGQRDWATGSKLIETCVDTYDTATGLSPEIVHFTLDTDEMDTSSTGQRDWYIKGARHPSGGILGDDEPAQPPYDARYILRPETVESLFIAFRLTGNVQYREYGWNIFQAIERHCRVATGGYASVLNVDDVDGPMEDKMETFLMSETFKYLYLLFSDADVLPLNEYVFNTEAHPFPIIASTRMGFS